MINQALLKATLALLAVYHLAVGATSVLSFGGVRRIAGVYGATLDPTPQLRYAVRMLGLYAMALGALMAFAAMEPTRFQPLIYTVAALQLARAACRVHFRDELHTGLGMAPRRNAIAVSLLLIEAAVLLAA